MAVGVIYSPFDIDDHFRDTGKSPGRGQSMRLKFIKTLALWPLVALLWGCDTEEALLQQRLDVLTAEENALKDIQATFGSDPQSLEGPNQVSLFVSKDVINGILQGADNVTIEVPDLKGATITVESIRANFKMGYPLLDVKATAQKEGLDATLSLVGVARLIPTIEPASESTPSQLQMKVVVDSLVPRAQWGFFDFKIGGFVRDLSQVKINDELRTAGVIRLPLETSIPLSIPAKQTPVSFTGATVSVATPDLSVTAKVSANRFIVLPDGLHVHGQINVASGG